ncbi:MAG: AbrB/MazE/SpoVT family DNA-binding domain-containing protein [Microthrixaceae bacterium]
MGDRGRLVVPVELRASAGLDEGTPVVMLETAGGIVLLTRDQALARLRDDLAGEDLLDLLLRERRAAAAAEDVAVEAVSTS